MLCRAIAYVVSDTPLTAILSEAKKVSSVLHCFNAESQNILVLLAPYISTHDVYSNIWLLNAADPSTIRLPVHDGRGYYE